MDVTKEIDLLKRYFKNKASEGMGIVTLNDKDVLGAFARLVTSVEMPKSTWIEHSGSARPSLPRESFGIVEFRDGEKRAANLYNLPEYMWIHTDEPEVISNNSVKRRAAWKNQIIRFLVQDV